MTTTTIRPNQHLLLEYRAPAGAVFEFYVDADRPVKTYLLRPKGLQRFYDGEPSFRYYGGYPEPRATQEQRVVLPHSGRWYLVIMNPDRDRPVRVGYDVKY